MNITLLSIFNFVLFSVSVILCVWAFEAKRDVEHDRKKLEIDKKFFEKELKKMKQRSR